MTSDGLSADLEVWELGGDGSGEFRLLKLISQASSTLVRYYSYVWCPHYSKSPSPLVEKVGNAAGPVLVRELCQSVLVWIETLLCSAAHTVLDLVK